MLVRSCSARLDRMYFGFILLVQSFHKSLRVKLIDLAAFFAFNQSRPDSGQTGLVLFQTTEGSPNHLAGIIIGTIAK